MPHLLVETPTFDSTVTVPDGGDSRSNAAEAVASIAQSLANRTQFTKAALDALAASISDVARRSADNGFSGRNTFDQNINFAVLSANDPLIGTGVQADQDPDHPGNRWKHLFDFKCAGGGHHAHMFSGTDAAVGGGGSAGAFAIVYNAYWDIAAQLWHKHDTSKAATALIWQLDRIRVCAQPIGGGVTWADWSFGPLLSGALTVAGALTVSGAVTVGGALVADSFAYPSPVEVTSVVPLILGQPLLPVTEGLIHGALTVAGNAYAPSGVVFVSWPLILPPGAELRKVVVFHGQSSSAPSQFVLKKRGASDLSIPSIPDAADYAFASSTTAGISQTTTLDLTDPAIAPDGPIVIDAAESYLLTWLAGAGGASGDRVFQIELTWRSPGPR